MAKTTEKFTLERLGDYYWDDEKEVTTIAKAQFPKADVKLVKKTRKKYTFEITHKFKNRSE